MSRQIVRSDCEKTLHATDHQSIELTAVMTSTEIIVPVERPDASQVADFKAHVQAWLELDTDVARLVHALRERRDAKARFTENILAFMCRFGVVHLDLRDCRLSCSVRHVRAPLPQRVIQERLVGMYANDPVAARTISDAVFSRDRVERVSLRKRANTVPRSDPGIVRS